MKNEKMDVVAIQTKHGVRKIQEVFYVINKFRCKLYWIFQYQLKASKPTYKVGNRIIQHEMEEEEAHGSSPNEKAFSSY